MEFKNALNPQEQAEVFSSWKDQGLTLEVDSEKSKILGISPEGSIFLEKKIQSKGASARIQYPGHLYELEGVFEERFFKVSKVYKVNRREAFRVDTKNMTAQASFTYSGNLILAKVEDLSMAGVSLAGPFLLKDVKMSEIIPNVKITLEENREITVDLQIKRVLSGDKSVKLGASFMKIHTTNGNSELMNFINSCYRRLKKGE